MVAIFTGAGTGFDRGSGSVLGSLGLLGSSGLGRGGEQLFFNASTGNLMVSQRDEFLVGLGLDAAVSRTYNSLGDLSDDNGDNWRQGYDKRITNLTGTLNSVGSTVNRVSGDGSVVTYSWDATRTAYVTTDGAGAYDTLTSSSGVWTWTDGNSRTVETYAAYGASWRLASQSDTDGNSLSFSYTADKLTQVATADGSTISYSWSGNNLTQVTTGYTDLATATAKTLTRTRYAYDASNRLSSVTVDLSPEDSSIADGKTYVTSYSYVGTSTLIASIVQSDGSRIDIGYDGSNRVASLTETASSGVTRVTGVSYGAGYTDVTDPLGLTTRLAYNANGSLAAITLPPSAAGVAQQQIQFGYTANGDVGTVTDTLGNVTSYLYDANGNATSITDRLGNVVTRTYGAKNELLTETTTGSDAGSGAAAHTVRYAYDGENHLRYRISAEGLVAEYRYTAAGQLATTVEYPEQFYDVSALASTTALSETQLDSWVAGIADKSATQITLNLYDARGSLTSTESYGIATTAGASSAAEGSSKSLFVYDQAGNLRSRNALGRNVETYVYDGMNRVTAALDVNGATTTYVFNDAASTTTVTFATGLTQVSTYNLAGELISFAETATVTNNNLLNIAPDLSDTSKWTATNVALSSATLGGSPATKVTSVTAGVTNSLTTPVTVQARDKVSIDVAFLAVGTQTKATLWLTAPGAQGLIITVVSGPGTVIPSGDGLLVIGLSATQATYLHIERAVSIGGTVSISLGAGDLSRPNLVAAGTAVIVNSPTISRIAPSPLAAATGTASYAYDKDGRLRWQVDATGRKSYFVYDQLGRKVADVSSGGDVVEYRYDGANRLAAKVVHGARLTAAQVTALDNQDAVVDLTTLFPASNAADRWSWTVYDKEGRVLQAIAGDGTTSVLAYDGAGRLVSTTSYANKLSAAQLTAFQAAAPTVVTVPTADAKDAVSRSFYDKDGRLLGMLDGEGYLSRSVYDKAGQKIQETRFAAATAAGYRASGSFNQLLGSVLANAAADRNIYYSYDGQGQLRYAIDGLSFVTQTDYDSAGQATTVTRYAAALAATADYTYDNVKALVTSGNLAASVGTRLSWTVYDSAGRAAYAIDPENAVTGFSYNAAGQLIKTIRYATLRATASLPTKATMDSWATTGASATDRVSRFYYDGSGQLRYTIDGEGYASQQDVDAEGRVTKTIRWSNKIIVADSATIDTVTSLLTSGGGVQVQTLTAYDALGRVDTVTNAAGIVARNQYDATGLVSDTILAWGTSDAVTTHYVYDAAGRVLASHAAYGTSDVAITSYAYDGLGNVLTVTDPLGHVTTRTYDHLGQLLTQTDALAGVTSWQYDGLGQAVKTTDALGRSTFNYYDRRGQLVALRDAEDYVTETIYTAFGQVDTVTRRYNKATGTAVVGTLPTVTANASKDALTRLTYDRLGRVTRTTDAEGYYEQYTLDAFGGRTAVLNKLGGTITNVYDRRGLLVSETLPMASVNSAGTTVAGTVTNTFLYDSRGNRTRMVEASALAEQRTTNYTYDALDRLTAKTLNAVTKVGYSDFTSTTAVTVTTASAVPTEAYVYDALGRLKQVTSPLGARTVSFYDKLGRKTAEVGPLGTMTAWTYDKAGNMLTMRVYGDAVVVPAATATTPPAPVNGANYRETVYAYDNLDRLTSTSVANVQVGVWNGSTGVSPVTQTVTSSQTYDANGNVIKTTDANGNVVFSYYDKFGRKTVQADQENYLTSWTYDGEGNVLAETRFATKYAGTPVAGGTAPTVAADAANDRTTTFTYDRNGHRLTETRSGVVAWSVSTINGALTQTGTSSVVTYSYNALGQVLTKAEATGDTVAYTYDATGRLTKESRASYLDQLSATSVTPTVDYYYNGLGDLSRTRQGGASGQAGDRITTYAYGAGGRLASLTDPSGAVHNYDYDVAGNVVRDSYSRLKSDGVTSVTEGILYARDLLGRVTAQTIATFNSTTSWTRGDSQNSQYNVYGEIAQRGVNGLWQEQFTYDNAGHLIKNNSGDGVWRFFVYDANGNRTLTLESEGTDLSLQTQAQALALAGATAGSTFVDGINVAITTYDKRNQLTSSILPQRELSAAGARVSITNGQVMNAFGEVTSQTDARGYTTTFGYNMMGRLISKVMPQVSVTGANGAVSTVNPAETYYYDLAGRAVASRDANGNLTSRTLLAGSGYGQAEALVAAEYHADGGIAKSFYDMFGDARVIRNELNQDETRTYDGMGRLLTQVHRGALLTDNFTYDLLGQRITHWNSQFGSAYAEKTDYDGVGRIVSQIDFMGHTDTTSYVWDGTLITTGFSANALGGWVETTTYANNRQSVSKADLFGHEITKSDLGGHVFASSYDAAGRVTSRGIQQFTWFNSGKLSKTATITGTIGSNVWDRIATTYSYDATGNRLTELNVDDGSKLVTSSFVTYPSPYSYQYANQTATYDALGRLTSMNEAGSAYTPAATLSQQYDAAGNIVRTTSTHFTLDMNGTASTATTTDDFWFRYDTMNRVVTDKGQLSGTAGAAGTTIVRALTTAAAAPISQDIVYDLLGNRLAAIRTNYSYSFYTGLMYQEVRDNYDYDNAGRLSGVRITQGAGVLSAAAIPAAPATGGVNRSLFSYDALGRQTSQNDYDAGGTTVIFSHTSVYNMLGQLTSDSAATLMNDASTYKTDSTYTLTEAATGLYALGAVGSVTATNYKNNIYQLASSTTNTLAWYDGAVQSSISYTPTVGQSTVYTTSFTYDGLGQLTSLYIGDGRPRSVKFRLNGEGQIIRRDEADNNYSTTTGGDPHEIWYRFNGRELGYVGNNGTSRLTDPASIDDRRITNGTGAFRHNQTSSTTYNDFAESLDPINSYSQGSAGGHYVVQRTGETLGSIAQTILGDAGLWYKIAEANGIDGDTPLVEGRQLIIPQGVVKSAHNADTLKPYNPADDIGDVSPTTPKPPKHHKCGTFGQILLVAIAVAVAVALPHLAPGIAAAFGGGFGGAVAAGAIAGVAGSVVSQGVGLALGIQDKFSFKQVALSALAGGISGGLSQLADAATLASGALKAAQAAGRAGIALTAIQKAAIFISKGFLGGVARGVFSSVATQGIAVATGLQSKFDWAGVAAAGIGGGVGNIAGAKLGLTGKLGQYVSGMAGGVAGAAATSLVTGNDFGDTLMAQLPSIIGNTIGNALGDAISERTSGGPADASKDETAANASSSTKMDGASINLVDDFPGGATLTLAALSGASPTDPFSIELLNLGPNEKYRAAIKLGSDVSGLEPAALATLVSAEASVDAKTGVWNSNSYNKGSKAAGLTQFLESTWLGEAGKGNTYIGQIARQKGYVDVKGNLVPEFKSDLLNLRFDPTLSIVAAAQYAKFNLQQLARRGVLPSDLSPAGKAKIAYLAHHEGLGGATQFLKNNMNYAERLGYFASQVPSAQKRNSYIQTAGGSVGQGYRMWLTDYINSKIVVTKYMKPVPQKAQ